MLVGLLNEHPDLNIDLLLLPRFANLANHWKPMWRDVKIHRGTGRYMVTKMASFRMYLYGSRKVLARHPPIREHADIARREVCRLRARSIGQCSKLNFFDELGFTPRRRLCCTGMMAQCETGSDGF